MKFYKYESIGNDFVLVENSESAGKSLTEIAIQLCDRRFGIGGDGLLILDPSIDPLPMRMFNPDGTEDFCGNGLRCAALHMALEHNAGKQLTILHGGVTIPVEFTVGGWIDVTLPPPSFEPRSIPLVEGIGEVFDRNLHISGYTETLTSVSTGSTHTVVIKDSPMSEQEFRDVSPALEHHEWFPKRTSVIWAWQTGPKSFQIRIWERGVGETLGCGTGSAALAAYWFRKNPNALALEIRNPGGEVAAAKGAGGSIVISARAKKVFAGNTIERGVTVA
jgi:diaminopimelate epimerase